MKEQIENLLFEKYRTSIDVSEDEIGYVITPQDNYKLTFNLDSEDYYIFINKIEEAVNLFILIYYLCFYFFSRRIFN